MDNPQRTLDRKSRRVCILTSVHPAFGVRIFHKEAKTLVKAGYDVTLIARHNKNETVDGVKVIALSQPKSRFHRMFIMTWKIYRLAKKQKANVYHFHDPELIPVGIFLKLSGQKVIYDVHEDYGKQTLSKPYLPKFTRKSLAWCISCVEKSFSRVFDSIVTATDEILKNFSHHKYAVAVSNFPILSNFAQIKKNTGNNSGPLNLICVGSLTEIRGITQTVSALAHINSNRKVKLTLYGMFYPPVYKEQVKRLKGFEKVEYLGWIESQEIPKRIAQADAGIVCYLPEPNHINAMPNKLFEYMAAGIPVIASNFALWKEIIEGNNCGIIVNPLNPKEMAKAVEWLIEHPNNAEEMGENGRRAILEKYNWESESKKLLKVYEELYTK